MRAFPPINKTLFRNSKIALWNTTTYLFWLSTAVKHITTQHPGWNQQSLYRLSWFCSLCRPGTCNVASRTYPVPSRKQLATGLCWDTRCPSPSPWRTRTSHVPGAFFIKVAEPLTRQLRAPQIIQTAIKASPLLYWSKWVKDSPMLSRTTVLETCSIFGD